MLNEEVRIGFMGASGTGKTTLTKWVSETYGLPINPIGARSVARDMGFANPYDVDGAGRRSEFQHRTFVMKRRWEEENDRFVTDRTFIDNLAYVMMHDYSLIDDIFLAQNEAAFGRYTCVIFCPMSSFFNIGDDPVRVKVKAYHEMFEAAVAGLIERFLARRQTAVYIPLRHSDLEDRKTMIATVLKLKGVLPISGEGT